MDELNTQILYERRGYYCPTFFKLVVETIYDLNNLNNLGEEPFSTFFHEYIHFLQDISTTYGLTNCCIVVDRIKYINKCILENKSEKTFKIPFDFSKAGITKLNKNIQNVYLGTNPGLTQLDINKIQLENSLVQLPIPNSQLNKVVIYYNSATGTIESFEFGALCIIESMAHIAQKSILSTIEHDDVPYKVASLVAKQIYPIIGDNPFFTYSFCDACLMTHHPGEAFYQLLQLMKKDNYVPTSEIDIYNYVYNNISANSISLLDIFSQTIDSASESLSDYFTTKYYENERKWVKHILEKVKEIRLNQPDFMLQIIKNGKTDMSKFIHLFEEIGTPLIANMDDKSWFNPPKGLIGTEIHIDRFAAIREIFCLYELGYKKCKMKNYCQHSPDGDITDIHCDNSPWERSNQKRLCAYGALWRTWGLNDYTPV